jgi:hypothetical protein
MRLPPRAASFVLACSMAGTIVACDPQPTEPTPAPASPPEITWSASATCAPPACDRIVSTVRLRWRPSDAPIVGYRVLRDGEEIASLPPIGPASTSLRDRSAEIGATYRYEVEAVRESGARLTSPVEDVTVPLPPVDAAQLEGAFRVERTVTRSENLRVLEGIRDPRPGLSERTTWIFVASCLPKAGACPVRWNGHRGALTPARGTYRGSSAAGAARCPDGSMVDAPIAFRIVVTRAEVVGGAWVAAAIRGRFTSSFACPGFLPSIGAARFTGVRRAMPA